MSLSDQLETFFRSRPNTWVDGMQLSKVAGQYAWRSRCADLRRRGMQIDNRQRRLRNADGKPYTISEYKFTAVSLLDLVELSPCASGAASECFTTSCRGRQTKA